MQIDIRGNEHAAIDSIRVADRDEAYYVAEVVERGESGVNITDTDSGKYVSVLDKEHAQNLIKGLQKAIDLGWFD